MRASLAREYQRQRKAGWKSSAAIRNAKIKLAFESRNDVRLVWIPDETFDDSYIDTWTDQTQAQRDKARKELWESIERNGVWGLTSEVRCLCCDEWTAVDSCWGFVGQDAAGYEFDLMQSALDAARINDTDHNSCIRS